MENPTPETASAIPADLAALAASADAQLDQAGALPVSPELAAQAGADADREAAELTAALCLAIKAGGFVEPALPRYYTPEACSEISAAYLACADKYGWTWHKSIATGPELTLGAAIVVPAFMVYQERTARLQAEADAARARQLAARGGPPGAHQAAAAVTNGG